MNQETEVLLYCLGASTNEISAARLEQLLPSDWEGIIQKSLKHGVAPLLYQRLKTIGLSINIPVGIVQRLRKIYLHSAVQNMRLYNELDKILKLLKSARIDVIVLKGAALAKTVYKNIALRPAVDIDLLFRKNDVYRAYEKIMQLGFKQGKNSEQIFPSDLHKKYSHLTVKHLPDLYGKFIRIDVHWHLIRGATNSIIFTDEVWKKAQSFKIDGVDIFILSPEYLLQYLCTHLEMHRERMGFRLLWLYDIAETIRVYKDKINWKYLLESCKKYKIEEPVYNNLYLAWKYLGTPIPENTLNDYNYTDEIESENYFISILENKTKKLKQAEQQKELKYLKKLTNVNGFHNKFHYLMRSIFPAKKWMLQRYSLNNKKIVYFYYLIRLSMTIYRGLNLIIQILSQVYKKFYFKSKS